MNTTAAAQSPFDRFANHDDFLGFGYIGSRRNELDSSDPEAPARPELVAAVDAWILEIAAERGWDEDRLFQWANSKDGRWFADVMFGSSGPMAERRTMARRYI